MVTHAPLRLAFFGTPEFAVPTLAALLASRHIVVGVITQPDRPRGRGHHLTASRTKAFAVERGIPVLQPERLKDEGFLTAFRALDADLGVVAAYGRIITDAMLSTPRLGMINVHASLLPRWRGAAPVHRALLAGDRETGVTIMRVVRELDAGPMLVIERRAIGDEETSADVERALAEMGAALAADTVERLSQGPVPEEPQPDAGVTYADRITKGDSPIFWWRSAHELHNQVRGLHPWPHASTTIGGHRLLILKTAVSDGPAPSSAVPGSVLQAEADSLVIAAGHGTLRILELRPEGRRTMTTREFLAGHKLAIGARME
jgi:methionyl-tRNA formyltransferase